ncbi:MAG: thiamine diphosphokinase [Bacteroidales bacterium]
MNNETVILADGSFPVHEIPVGLLKNAARVICCDGAASALLSYGIEPFAIVGDCDSLDPDIIAKYHDRVYRDPEQETNDLTKSVCWAVSRGFTRLFILGATGKREDHTLGNISLLTEYASLAEVRMITDTGVIQPVLESGSFDSSPGQQVSIFSIDPATVISTRGLLYPLESMKLRNWWQATLNEATGTTFSLDFTGGPLLVYMKFKETRVPSRD